MSKRQTRHQQEFWINTAGIAASPGHPFYQRLSRLLDKHGFDRFVESRCEISYAQAIGRPGIPLRVYFRILLIGYFEAI